MMWTLKQAAEETGLPYSALRKFCLDGKVAFVRSGTKYYINRASLLSFLSGEQTMGVNMDVRE